MLWTNSLQIRFSENKGVRKEGQDESCAFFFFIPMNHLPGRELAAETQACLRSQRGLRSETWPYPHLEQTELLLSQEPKNVPQEPEDRTE